MTGFELSRFIPAEVVEVGLTLFLSFLLGLEREEHRQIEGKNYYSFGGVRTFPLIGLSGYVVTRISNENPLAVAIGFLTIGALLWLSYRKKLEMSGVAGMTSEVSALFTFLIGALVAHHNLWMATTLGVITLLLLELKQGLERLARRLPEGEILTFTRFLLLSAVILPVVPNEAFTQFQLNPQKLWLIVVAISAISYLSYVVGKFTGKRSGLVVTALLGGLYSSTVTTVVLAKNSKQDPQGRLSAGAMLLASGLMYFRLIILLALFNSALAGRVAVEFLVLGTLGCVVGTFLVSGRGEMTVEAERLKNRNPLEVRAAFLFAILFVVMVVATQLIHRWFGASGVYGLSFLSGLSDVDPFVMSLSQLAGHATALGVAAISVAIAAAANNLIKGVYAYVFSTGGTRKSGFVALAIYGLVGFAALALI